MRTKPPPRSDRFLPRHQLGNRQDSVYDHCIMMIATGKWPAGMRMPSVREAETAWGVNRVAIHEAYKRLASHGIAISKPRSGYYVTGQENIHRISNYRVELENLYRTFSETVTQTTGLAALPVFRYLASLAHIRDKEAPMCAFAECTQIQAEAHAEEVVDRLRLAVLPMTVREIAHKRNRIPPNVRVLLTTHFHYAELAPLRQSQALEVVAVPVQVSTELVGLVKDPGKTILLLEKEQETAGTVAEDVGRILNRPPLEIRIADPIHSALTDILGPCDTQRVSETVVFVSPHEWGTIDQQWRDHPNVYLVPFQIRKEAWELIADVVGMPLGTLG